MNIIKTLDWRHAQSSETIKYFIEEIKDSFHNIGFVAIKNHPISKKLYQDNKILMSDFFKKLSLTQRLKYESPYAGYTQIGVEKGEYAKVADAKHFFHVAERRDSNPYISEIPILKNKCYELFQSYNSFYQELMEIVALSLDNDRDFFTSKLGNSTLRHLHYPASSVVTSSDEEVTRGGNIAGMCASKHTDINMLTLLLVEEDGLELWYNNKWVKVRCEFDTIIINVGDMLEHITSGFYRSCIHRVVCTPNVERFSSPFFGHVLRETYIVPIAYQWMKPKDRFNFKYAGDFLDHRLKEIGVI